MKFWQEETRKKLITILALLFVAVLFFWVTQEEEATVPDEFFSGKTGEGVCPSYSEIRRLEMEQEEKIAQALSLVKGVGQVRVSVTYQEGLRKEYAQNKNESRKNIEEADQGGGTRKTAEISQSGQVVFSGETPVLVWESRPVLAGVLIVAEGGGEEATRREILEAVRVLLDIPPEKINISAMEEVREAFVEVKL